MENSEQVLVHFAHIKLGHYGRSDPKEPYNSTVSVLEEMAQSPGRYSTCSHAVCPVLELYFSHSPAVAALCNRTVDVLELLDI